VETVQTSQFLEERIGEWRRYLSRRQILSSVDVEELEDHLRSEITSLNDAGLKSDEAFLVAVKRLGNLDAISREFALEYSERLWKQLILSSGDDQPDSFLSREGIVAVGLAVAAAVAVKVPELFGVRIAGSEADNPFYLRNFTFFVLPFLAAFFAWKRDLDRVALTGLAGLFVASAFVLNVIPFQRLGHTEILAGLHLPIVLWLAVGFAYTGGSWKDHERRMNFVRFTGEWFIYYTLIAFGGGVLMMCTFAVFNAIGVQVEWFVQSWVLPCGVVGAILISAWLVEAKQSVIENMAPVLTRLFTPLFLLMLLAFLATMIWTGSGINVEREVLITFDLLLVLVLGLLLYSISAREPNAPPGLFDTLQLLLVVVALVVDAFALWAIAARITEFGFSPNRVAALGENLVLLVNLGWSAVLYLKFLRRRTPFGVLERWQTAYLPVYGVWAAVVVVCFPVLFRYQ
jgi:hypothetical protein